MKTSFQIITAGFARHILGNRMTGDPVVDSLRSLTMNHELKKGTTSRLGKWAIFRESGATLASELAGYPGGDGRTAGEAFADELIKNEFGTGIVFVTFSKALVSPAVLRATYDLRCVSICSPDGVETFDTTDPTVKHWVINSIKKRRPPSVA